MEIASRFHWAGALATVAIFVLSNEPARATVQDEDIVFQQEVVADCKAYAHIQGKPESKISSKETDKFDACVDRRRKDRDKRNQAELRLGSVSRRVLPVSQRLPAPMEVGSPDSFQNLGPGPTIPTTSTPYVGNSASNTQSTCGTGGGANNSLIRVHRALITPKSASDDFGYRLGRRYLVYQVTIENENKDYQYLIHDVSIDLSALYGKSPGTYQFTASSQDLTLLRGVPEKGQDLDSRNLLLHVLQGVGSVAGAVSGLTAFSDVMGSSVAVFNGSFLQGYVGIAPDHTSTQLNRLSDYAWMSNTLVDKQRARTLAIFIPEASILSNLEQTQYWKDPYTFLQTTLPLYQADVCVDGAFITTVAPPTLTAAVLSNESGTAPVANTVATLSVKGTNLSTSDTQVVGLGPTVLLTTASGTSGSVDVTLPADYGAGMSVHLASAANPSVVSGTIPTTVALKPVLIAAYLTSSNNAAPANGSPATLTVVGSNLIAGDTQVIGLGSPLALGTVTGTTGSVAIVSLNNYTQGMEIHLQSAAAPALASAMFGLTLPSLTSAVLPAGTLAGGAQVTLTLAGAGLSSDLQIVGFASPAKLQNVNAGGTTATATVTLASPYVPSVQVHLQSVGVPAIVSQPVAATQ